MPVIPSAKRHRYEALIERRRAGTLEEEERAELLRLTDEMEAADAERLERLASLARLYGVSLDAILEWQTHQRIR
jgi:hypothetical protein